MPEIEAARARRGKGNAERHCAVRVFRFRKQHPTSPAVIRGACRSESCGGPSYHSRGMSPSPCLRSPFQPSVTTEINATTRA